ncbi:flagellar biosynthetic protein FliO [Enterobacter pasteurii]|uniref:flagellar biosynthetic protein FliO n=1 Tax=Enterobacter pasteurii TaxID=3029761 RepID=UPI0011DCF4F2|nr:flagellar biosynthetic protein FliO [Enterobacter pasteurii]QLA68078.1 flagellar biosynthetic protein FliO [Enterobacter pasteurii]
MNNQSLSSVQQVIPSTVDTASDSVFINVGGALVLVLLLIALLAWFFRRSGITPRVARGSVNLSVKSSLSLGQRERVMLVEIDDKWLLLGVTPQAISCLTTMERKAFDKDDVPEEIHGNFSAKLLNILNNKNLLERK